MFCPKCGTENAESSKFCQKCGSMIVPEPAKSTDTSLGIEPNLGGLLSYALGWITGLIMILLEKKNGFIRFHAVQSMVAFGAISILLVAFGILDGLDVVGSLFWALSIATWILAVILWIVLMVKAYQGERYKLPIAGDIAEKNS
jgi:uncharacterized membrane protein